MQDSACLWASLLRVESYSVLTCGSELPASCGGGGGKNERKTRFILSIKELHPPFPRAVPQRRRALAVAPETADRWGSIPSWPVLRAPTLCPPRCPLPPWLQYLSDLVCRSPGKTLFVPAVLEVVLLG